MVLLVLLLALLSLLIVSAFFWVWHAFIAVPYIPTSMTMVSKMVQIAAINKNDTVYDLGAGDGRLLLYAKNFEPTCNVIGYELLPSAYLMSLINSWRQRLHIQLHWRSFFSANLQDADIVFCYLFPAVMQQLEQKFQSELRPSTRIISHAFQLKLHNPVAVHTIQDGNKERKIYEYVW